jgi:peptide/nickel transport system permease protein
MWKVAARRLVLAVPMLLVVLTATFLLQQLIPGDPASFVMGQSVPAAQRAQVDASFGLDRSLFAQYLSWIGGAVRGRLGLSWVISSGQPVTHIIGQALPVTLSLAGLAALVTLVVGVALGTWAAVVRGGIADRLIQVVASVAVATPGYWVAVGLVYLLAIDHQVFPATGYVPIGQSPSAWLHSLVLPVIALALSSTGTIALQARSAMADVLGRDYIRSLRALGMPPWRIIGKHALRNAATPIVTTMGFSVLGLLATTVIIEQLFNQPGLGRVLLTAVVEHDIPVVQGVVVFFAVAVVVVNVAVDLSVALLNPRERA